MRIPPEAIPIIQAGVPRLGEARFPSPLSRPERVEDWDRQFQNDSDRVLVSPYLAVWRKSLEAGEEPLGYELAGPRREIFFDPKSARAAIVTCGGLCPGLNDVIRRLVLSLHHHYGVTQVYGIRYGYQGLVEGRSEAPILLTAESIEPISNEGGTFLGSSRGDQDSVEMVDFLHRRKIGVLFTIGGDGTQRGALAIAREAEKRGYALSVVGLPKTIDCDIGLVEKTFGFDTAVSIAAEVLRGAHVESEAEKNGIVIVKLMGRQSGFLATHASIASGDVNFILIPEVRFDLEGEKGLLAALKSRLERRGHALIVVAEGVVDTVLSESEKRAAQGPDHNPVLDDVGVYLKDRISRHFKAIGFESRIRYIDPSYYVRSLPAIPIDSIFCQNLANHAVHAAMSGRTRLMVATCNGVYCHIPLEAVVLGRRYVDPNGPLWRSALETTGQPAHMLND